MGAKQYVVATGSDSRYNRFAVEDGRVVSIEVGDYRQGCSCRLDQRPESCTQERAEHCVQSVFRNLSPEDQATLLANGVSLEVNDSNRVWEGAKAHSDALSRSKLKKSGWRLLKGGGAYVEYMDLDDPQLDREFSIPMDGSGWIRGHEELTKGQNVLVTDGMTVREAFFLEGSWWNSWGRTISTKLRGIIAWMPMPAPLRREG